MQTQSNSRQFEFEAVEGRSVVAAFDGGAVSSEAGVLLLSGLDRGLGLIERFAACFDDGRDPDLIEHSVKTLVGQRVIGQIRARWPRGGIVQRADSGFAREALMAWCEANGVQYVFGLARNTRLEAEIRPELPEAKRLCE